MWRGWSTAHSGRGVPFTNDESDGSFVFEVSLDRALGAGVSLFPLSVDWVLLAALSLVGVRMTKVSVVEAPVFRTS
jgi:hypothetical protein